MIEIAELTVTELETQARTLYHTRRMQNADWDQDISWYDLTEESRNEFRRETFETFNEAYNFFRSQS